MSFHHVFLALTPFCPGHVHHRLRRRRGCLALGQLVDRMQKVWTTSRLTGWWSNWDRGIWWFGRAGFPAGRWLGRDSRIFQLSSSYIVYIDIYIYRCIFCFYYSAWDGGISSMFHVSSSYLSEMAIRQLIVFTLRFTWDQVQKTQQIL